MTHPLDDTPDPSEYPAYAADYVARVKGNALDALEQQIGETAQLLRSLPPELADHRYAAGKWSIREIVGHLSDSERLFSYRALRFSRGDATPLEGFDENDYVRAAPFRRVPLDDLVSELEHLRSATLFLFRPMTADELMRRGVANGIETSVRAFAFMIAGHEHHHVELLRTRYLA